MPKYLNGHIIGIENEAPQTKRFFVKVEDVEKIEFKAGQFVTMELPIHEKRLKRMRSYSIANAPDGSNIIEFCIVYLNEGLATTFFFKDAKVGTELKFKYPAGVFTLPSVIDHDLVFICTGTGVAPFRSMIQYIFNNDIPHKNIHLIFGTRYKEGILYKKEFENLTKKHPEFKYTVTLSREEDWSGEKGYVHAVYKKEYASPRSDIRFYLCGWSMMVDEAVEHLKNMGYDDKQIRLELYG